MDEFLDYALWLTVRELARHWLPRVKADVAFFGNNTRHLLYALRTVRDPSTVDVLDQLLRRGKLPESERTSVLEMLAEFGGPRQLRIVFDEALAGRGRATLLAALEQAVRQNRQRRPEGDLSSVSTLLKDNDPVIRASSLRLIGLWQVASLRKTLTDTAESTADEALRAAAAEGLALLGDAESRKELLGFCRPPHQLPLRMAAVAAFTAVDRQAAAIEAATVLGTAPPGTNASQLFAGPEALARALANKRLDAGIAAAGLRQISSTGRAFPQLAEALKTAGGLDPVAKAFSPEELKQFITDVQAKGDARRGELVYRRADLACMKCHAIGGVGGQVGADLLSIGASAQVDYLVESLLEPSKKIKEGHHTTNVLTTEGRQLSGVLVRKTDTQLLLRDQNDELLTIPLANIEKQEISRLSLMPEGTTKTLRRDELVELVRFLSELGKTGGIVPPKGQVVRRWRVLAQTAAVSDAVRHHGAAHAASDDAALTWQPAYSLVSGELPLEELPWHGYVDGKNFQFLRFEVKVTSAGKVGMSIRDAAGLRLWIGKREVAAKERVEAELSAGTHVITLASESVVRKMKPLRIEVVEVPSSPGRAELVLGK